MDLSAVQDFGGIAADEDELLRDCFQDHPAYAAARRGERFLIIGRKGSGKTAIYQKLLLEKSVSFYCFGHTFDDYPWPHHDLQAEVGVPEERRYIHSWRYLILLTLGKILLNHDSSQPWSEPAQESLIGLESFIVDSYGTRDPDVTQLFSPEKELRIKGIVDLKFVKTEMQRVRVRDLPRHVQEVNRTIQNHVIDALNPANDYFVCFDQLDLGFSPADAPYADRLTGLILAAREIQRTARAKGKKLSVIVFLRDDIYGTLSFEDKNKITESNLAAVEWGTSEGGRLTLKGLMERRFGQVLGRDDSIPWDEVFDEDQRMTGRQRKYDHICDRTFLRPRDMIKFCNEILAAHRSNSIAERFVNEDIINARAAYSDYLLRELDDEIAKHVPQYKDYLAVVGAIGRETFRRDTFMEAWSKREHLRTIQPNQALQQLFDFSVIGYLKTGGGGGGSQWIWRYQDVRPHRAVVPADSETFRVHPGFKEALDLTQGGGTQ